MTDRNKMPEFEPGESVPTPDEMAAGYNTSSVEDLLELMRTAENNGIVNLKIDVASFLTLYWITINAMRSFGFAELGERELEATTDKENHTIGGFNSYVVGSIGAALRAFHSNPVFQAMKTMPLPKGLKAQIFGLFRSKALNAEDSAKAWQEHKEVAKKVADFVGPQVMEVFRKQAEGFMKTGIKEGATDPKWDPLLDASESISAALRKINEEKGKDPQV